jgi:hypothetical protein
MNLIVKIQVKFYFLPPTFYSHVISDLNHKLIHISIFHCLQQYNFRHHLFTKKKEEEEMSICIICVFLTARNRICRIFVFFLEYIF